MEGPAWFRALWVTPCEWGGPCFPSREASRGREQPCSLLRFQKRRLEKVRRRREEAAAERLEQELLRDTVEFGEVALQPPELTAKPRTSGSGGQPGKKPLMLKMLLSSGGVSQPPATSLARRRIVQEERERAVQAYRALKKLQQQQRLGTQSPRPPCPEPGKKPQTRV